MNEQNTDQTTSQEQVIATPTSPTVQPQPNKPEEVIIDEIDFTDESAQVPRDSHIKFTVGSKVRIKNYPPPVDPKNAFDWNGLVGTVKGHFTDPTSGLVFYDIVIENVQVPFARLNPQTNKLQRGYIKTNAANRFDDSFLERA
jgi:hypothetical protein